MNKQGRSSIVVILLLACVSPRLSTAQKVNTWQDNDVSADWNEPYQWTLNHAPAEGEAVLFRATNSVVSVYTTIQLDSGMHLYGQELRFKGNGRIDLVSQVPHKQTVNIPASADGLANLTLCDNLSLNGRISLSAKEFGTSDSKGTITLKDRSSVTGILAIGVEGVGSGQVFVEDNATFRITGLELNTRADAGGTAEIHIRGGTVRIEDGQDLMTALLEDPSRKIIIGAAGTLRIESSLPIAEKKAVIKALIANRRVVPAQGCRLTLPVLQDDMIIARAEDDGTPSTRDEGESLLSAIDDIPESAVATSREPADIRDLVQSLSEEIPVAAAANAVAAASDDETGGGQSHAAGYIVFFGMVLLTLRRGPGRK